MLVRTGRAGALGARECKRSRGQLRGLLRLCHPPPPAATAYIQPPLVTHESNTPACYAFHASLLPRLMLSLLCAAPSMLQTVPLVASCRATPMPSPSCFAAHPASCHTATCPPPRSLCQLLLPPPGILIQHYSGHLLPCLLHPTFCQTAHGTGGCHGGTVSQCHGVRVSWGHAVHRSAYTSVQKQPN